MNTEGGTQKPMPDAQCPMPDCRLDITAALTPFQSALQIIAAHPTAAWVVGGTVRDALLGRPIHDVDIAVAHAATGLARQIADQLGASFVPLDAAHDVARVVLPNGDYLDLAALRGPTIEDDLRARDLTINALAVPLLPADSIGPLIDPLGGAADVAAGRLRLCHAAALQADPLRVLRVVRIAAQLGWTFDPQLDRAIRDAAPLIATVALERVRDEWLALLGTRWSAMWLRYLDRAGVLDVLIPELAPMRGETQPIVHVLDVWEHVLQAVCAGEWMLAQLNHDNRATPAPPPAEPSDPYPPIFFAQPMALMTQPDLHVQLQWGQQVTQHMHTPVGSSTQRAALWKFAILLHDIAKPATRADKPDGSVSFHGHQSIGADVAAIIGRRFRLSRTQINYITAVVEGHMRPGQLNAEEQTSARAAYRFFRDLGDAAVDTLLHSLADHLATKGPQLSAHGWAMHQAWTDAMLGFHWDRQTEERRAPLINGTMLMQALGLQPGPQIGLLLEAIREAQAAGDISTADEALALALRLQT